MNNLIKSFLEVFALVAGIVSSVTVLILMMAYLNPIINVSIFLLVVFFGAWFIRYKELEEHDE